MDKCSEDVLITIFKYIPYGSFLFVSLVSKQWETSYRKSDRGLFTNIRAISDSTTNFDFSYENGYDLSIFISQFKTYQMLFTGPRYEKIIPMHFFSPYITVLKLLIDKAKISQEYHNLRSDFFYISTSICVKSILYSNSFNNRGKFLDFVCSFQCLNEMVFPAMIWDYANIELKKVLVEKFGFPCGGKTWCCFTCQYCEDCYSRILDY